MGRQGVSTTTARHIRRRALLGGLALGTVGALLAACGGTAPATSAPSAAPVPTAGGVSSASIPVGGGASGVTATARIATPGGVASPGASGATPAAALVSPTVARRTAAAQGELRLAVGFDFPAKIDALKGGSLLSYGLLECLTRQTTQNTIEPWLAESVTNINPTTWRIVLRDATFWDGSPVTPEDVIVALKKNGEAYPDNKGLISPDTTLTALDARTIEFVTPQPSAIFPYALTLSNFGIFKTAADGTASILTGPYKPTKFAVGSILELAPHTGHWSGMPPIGKIVVQYVPDPNTRVLALQSGDVDMLYNFPPEALKTLGPDIEAPLIASGRIDLINLNFARLPFSDRDVREATALGIDRDVLNTVGLDGKGAPCTALFPPSTGYERVPLQGTDISRAKQLLDGAGWRMGTDGVRVKDGKRLAFAIHSYPGRAELTPYAVSIQSQLRPLGYDIQVTEVQNVADVIKTGDWDAAMKSNNTIATGDPLFEYNRLLATGGGDNVGKYANPRLDALLAQMRGELDPAKRRALSTQVQEIVKADVPMLFLVALPITTAYRKGKVRGYVPNPSDYYLIDTALSVTP